MATSRCVTCTHVHALDREREQVLRLFSSRTSSSRRRLTRRMTLPPPPPVRAGLSCIDVEGLCRAAGRAEVSRRLATHTVSPGGDCLSTHPAVRWAGRDERLETPRLLHLRHRCHRRHASLALAPAVQPILTDLQALSVLAIFENRLCQLQPTLSPAKGLRRGLPSRLAPPPHCARDNGRGHVIRQSTRRPLEQVPVLGAGGLLGRIQR